MRQAHCIVLLTYLILSICPAAWARKADLQNEPPLRAIALPHHATDNPASRETSGLHALASGNTTWLYSANFEGNGGACSAQGWTSVDLTAQAGDFWHVEDYAVLLFGPLEGSKSLWCGARPGSGYVLCQYQTLPGYGNSWDQRWCTKSCLPVAGGPTTSLDVSFAIRYDSEPSYDATSLEYTADCDGSVGWTEIDGGNPLWSGADRITVNDSYPLSGNPANVKVRLRFVSDTAWSDQDGIFPTDGAAHVDSLQVETLAMETFEDEAVGAISSNDWESCNTAYGDYAGLFKGDTVLQEDGCTTNVSCLWAFIQNSTANYACAGHPEQAVVPYGNERGEYIRNEIWSPFIELTGTGAIINLEFDVYRDLPLNPDIFYVWHVRTLANGCPTQWRDTNFLFYSDTKDWFRHVDNLASVINLSNTTHVQVSLGVIDMCPFWCGTIGTGQCHSHAPLFDNVRVYRVDIPGPHWIVRDHSTFQDAFATDGTLTGTAKASMARDIRPSYSPVVTRGDSAVVDFLRDTAYAGTGINTSGLSNDPVLSTFVGRHKTKKQVYMWVAVWPLDATDDPGDKVGEDLSDGPGGQANRYPFAGTQLIDGILWTKIRMDYTYTGTATNPGIGDGTDPLMANRFNVDLNDNLFVPGDTVCYFFGATSPGGTTYYSSFWHATESIGEVAANPMEFTILPAGGFNRGGDILYIDNPDGLGNQPYFEGAFMVLGLEDRIDRYDVRGNPFVGGSTEGLAASVYNIQQQLNDAYQMIIWDGGTMAITLGDGDGNPLKSDDYALLNAFLGNLVTSGGVYLSGDDVAANLSTSTSASAATFRSTYMPFSLSSGDHIAAGLGVSPAIKFWPGRGFDDDFIAFGGCPELNDFDVMAASGTSRVEMSYGASQSPQGAVLSNINGNARVILSGFSFAAIRDDEVNGISDRANYLRNVIRGLGTGMPPITGAGPAASDLLAQNYPNPFNPQTTIAFSIRSRGHVLLNVYNVAGQLVRTLANETRSPGAHTVTWDGRDEGGTPVSSGVYFYRLMAGEFSQTRKMVLLK